MNRLLCIKACVRICARLAGLCALCIALVPGVVAAAEPSEYTVKAAFIYNFAKFVEWPPEVSAKEGPFVIGILGDDPFEGALEEIISGKTIRDKKIIVKRFSKIEEAMGSHILFISNSEKGNISRIIKQLAGTHVLTVSDIAEFAEKGGIIELILEQNHVRFAVNVAVAEQGGLKPSSQLLKLARIVTKAKE